MFQFVRQYSTESIIIVVVVILGVSVAMVAPPAQPADDPSVLSGRVPDMAVVEDGAGFIGGIGRYSSYRVIGCDLDKVVAAFEDFNITIIPNAECGKRESCCFCIAGERIFRSIRFSGRDFRIQKHPKSTFDDFALSKLAEKILTSQ